MAVRNHYGYHAYKIAGLEGILSFFLLIASLSFWLLYKITEK